MNLFELRKLCNFLRFVKYFVNHSRHVKSVLSKQHQKFDDESAVKYR